MSIVVTCQNGHRLRASEKRAGTIGKCPACGAEVIIPEEKTPSQFPTDSSIMRILGVGQALRKEVAAYDAMVGNMPGREGSLPPDPGLPPLESTRKVCPQCSWEIDPGYKICPHCRYYFIE